MKKIRLKVEDLEVRSFATHGTADAPRGTVQGRQQSIGGNPSCWNSCFWYSHEFNTCDQTGPSCGPSCDWACDSYQVCEGSGIHC